MLQHVLPKGFVGCATLHAHILFVLYVMYCACSCVCVCVCVCVCERERDREREISGGHMGNTMEGLYITHWQKKFGVRR